MPYGNDEWLEKSERKYRLSLAKNAKDFDIELRFVLREKFDIPDKFMDLAVKIWWDGKED